VLSGFKVLMSHTNIEKIMKLVFFSFEIYAICGNMPVVLLLQMANLMLLREFFL